VLCQMWVDSIHLLLGLLQINTLTLTLHSGLLLVYENGTKVQVHDAQTLTCHSLATSALKPLLIAVVDAVYPFVSGERTLHLDRLPPFITFLVYKTASLMTERIWMASDSNEMLQRLRILRKFLELVNARWLCCGSYVPRLEGMSS
jgi:hypothetical protein